MYKLERNTVKKALVLTVGGLLTAKETYGILQDLHKNIQEIKPEAYTLIFEPQNIKPASFAVLSPMKKFLSLCQETSFQHVFFIESAHKLEDFPAAKFMKGDFYKKLIRVPSVSEALTKIR